MFAISFTLMSRSPEEGIPPPVAHAPWASRCRRGTATTRSADNRVSVVGAGLAFADTAYSAAVSDYTLVVERAPLPALVIHGGAGAYLKTTTVEQRLRRGKTLAEITAVAHRAFGDGGSRASVLAAIEALENDPGFNAGWGSRLQQDGEARLSAALMDGRRTRMSAIVNARRCRHPTALADALQERALWGDRDDAEQPAEGGDLVEGTS